VNQYSKYIENALSELIAYRSSHPEGLSDQHAELLSRELSRIKEMPDGAFLDQLMNSLARLIVDEYPLKSDFLPSLSAAFDARQRLKRLGRIKK